MPGSPASTLPSGAPLSQSMSHPTPPSSGTHYLPFSSPQTFPLSPSPPQRQAIKVFISTWNMGDSTPKGDLSVLLGSVPNYTPPDPPLPPGVLPDFSAGEDHPYHIVIIAAQECPTQSGVPRGIAAGVTKGMGGAKEKEQRREKERVREGKEREKERVGREEERFEDEGSENPFSPNSVPHHGHHPMHINVNTKGWSDILEDYFCHNIQPTRRNRNPLRPPSAEPTANPLSPPPPDPLIEKSASLDVPGPSTPKHPSTLLSPPPPELPRFNSAPSVTSKSDTLGSSPVPIGGRERERERMMAPSPLSMGSSISSVGTMTDGLIPPPHPASSYQPQPPSSFGSRASGARRHPSISAGSLNMDKKLPLLIIPGSPSNSGSPATPVETGKRNGAGPYHFLVKERLLGLYIAVFVHKDCKDLVLGHDKDYVPAGLVGGRVGNKGGIGVSLNLAGHRFLFVNSHLAAHTSRLDARLANIEKIQSELHLSNFLPPTDERSMEEDLTDRFDTVFWLGDLNFRLDMSRLHADWLVARKEYRQALEFDQLRKVMQEGRVFEGFEEGEIDFAPTFKYDVWRSVRRTKTVKRGNGAGKEATVNGVTVAVKNGKNGGLQELKEGSLAEEEELGLGNTTMIDEDDEESFSEGGQGNRRYSVDSSTWQSTIVTEPDMDGEESEGDPVHTVQQPPRPIAEIATSTAIKAKHKLLKLIKGPSLSPSPSSSSSGMMRRISISAKKPHAIPIGNGHASHISEALVASTASTSLALVEPPSMSSHEEVVALPISSSGGSISRPGGLSRQLSTKLKKSLSTRRGRPDSPDSSSGDEEDRREGVYDTSAKQRVPSWCDRVLWKAHIHEDPPPPPPKEPPSPDHPDKRLSRITQVLSHALHHRRNRDRPVSQQNPPVADDPTSPSSDSVHGFARLTRRLSPGSGSPPPARPMSMRIPSRERGVLDMGLSHSPEANYGSFSPTRVQTESAITRLRANSASVDVEGSGEKPSPPTTPKRGGSDSPTATRGGVGRLPSPVLNKGETFPRSRTIAHPGHGGGRGDEHVGEHEPFGAAKRWFSRVVYQRSSSENQEEAEREERERVEREREEREKGEEERKGRRRRKGEVECLRYGTLDDVGMRRLEGRS